MDDVGLTLEAKVARLLEQVALLSESLSELTITVRAGFDESRGALQPLRDRLDAQHEAVERRFDESERKHREQTALLMKVDVQVRERIGKMARRG
jgi:hypothetical protein